MMTIDVAHDDSMTERAERRRHWLERTGRELEVAETWEPVNNPERLVGQLDRMVEASEATDVLNPSDKVDIRDRARAIKLKAYQGHIDVLLEQAMNASRDKDRQGERGEILRLVNDAFNNAARLGLAAPIKQGIKDRLDIIRQTSAAGDSTTAKANAEREATREASRSDAGHPREQRTFTRWRDPSLVVTIAGRPFGTVDWSLGGALIADVENRGWRCGQTIDVKIGLERDKLYADKMVVVRYIAEQRCLAIRARRFASVLMQVKRDCDRMRIEPA
jgi:hypothetical protein